MSKFMFHIRFSNEGEFLHEHEIYEMMRSRNLYQLQFDLRRKLEKKIRTIKAAEKLHVATFQSRKALFLQKAQENIKLRNNIDIPVKGEKETGKYLPAAKMDDTKIDKWIENNEKIIPEPVDENQKDQQNTDNIENVSGETGDTRKESLTVTTAKVELEFKGKSLSGRKSAGLSRTRNCFSEPVPNRPTESNENQQNSEVSDNVKSKSKKGKDRKLEGHNKIKGEKEMKQEEHKNNVNEEKKTRDEEENDTKPRPLYLTSTSNLQRTMTDLTTKSGMQSDNEKVCQVVLPKLECYKPTDIKGRSRSSKNTLSGSSDSVDNDLNMKTKEITFMLGDSDGSVKKPNIPPFLSDNLSSKSLSTFEMGAVTPDGRILLTKNDYDQFLSKYRNAQKQRLRRSRRRSENLDQRVRDYRWNITEE